MYQLSDRSTLASRKTSLHYLRSHSGNERPLDVYSQALAFSCFLLSVMSQKSKQKSRGKPQLEDYAFPPSPQPQLFEHYAQFRDDEPALEPVLGHPSPSERRQKLLDKELELVKQEKEKLALELEVLRLRQALGPATPPTASAAQCATGKSDTKKKTIDWPQDFVPGTSINPEFNYLDFPSFVAGYLAMIRTYDTASIAHMVAILEVLMAKAISYTWAIVRGFYSYLARLRHGGALPVLRPHDFHDVLFTCDSSLHRGGATCFDECISFAFPRVTEDLALHINALELFVLVMAVKIWAPKLPGSRFQISCDNDAAVQVVRSGRTRDAFMQRCLRQLWLTSARYDLDLHVSHIPGVHNVFADCLSRWDANSTFQRKFYELASPRNLRFHMLSIDCADLAFDLP